MIVLTRLADSVALWMMQRPFRKAYRHLAHAQRHFFRALDEVSHVLEIQGELIGKDPARFEEVKILVEKIFGGLTALDPKYDGILARAMEKAGTKGG